MPFFVMKTIEGLLKKSDVLKRRNFKPLIRIPLKSCSEITM